MKKTKTKPARNRICVLAQLCKLIPSHATSRIVRELGDEKRARSFSAWSHVVALLYAQLCHSISLADVCDATALRLSRLSLLRVVAMVEIDGKQVEMAFISNNFKWAASSITELYLARWGIEVFFKQLKQTLQLSGFIGYSKNAIQWQVWAALLVWLLARFQAFLSQWPHSFSRLMALLRSHAWELLSRSAA